MNGLYLIKTKPLTVLVFLVALPLLLLALHVGHNIEGDEGVVLFGAWSLLSGHRPYIDDFQFITPASNYFLYWLWRLFGPNFWVAKGFAILCIYLGSLAIFFTSNLLDPSGQDRLGKFIGPFLYCAFSFFWPTINHNTFNACALSWALYFGVKYLVTNKQINLAVCGLLTGLSILFLQHKGGVFLLTLTAFFFGLRFISRSSRALESIKPTLLYIAFTCIPLLTLLNWSVSVLYTHLFDFPLNHYLAINNTSMFPLVATLVSFVLLAALVLPASNHATWLVLSVQTLLLGTTLQRPDVSHVLILTFPMLAVFFIPCDKLKMLFSHEPWLKKIARLGKKLAVTIILISGVVTWIFRNPSFENRPANWPLLQEAKSICKTLYAGPFLPGIYYELRLQNPTSFSYLLTNFNTALQFQKARTQLELAQPECAILHYENILNFNYDANNIVEEFFSQNYKVHLVSGSTKLLVLRKND